MSGPAKRVLLLSGADARALEGWDGGDAEGCVVNTAVEPGPTLALVELWGGGAGADAALRALGLTVRAYPAEETVERWTRPVDAGGLVQVAAWSARPELTPDEARRCWDEHVPLALRIHGCANYVRNWIGGDLLAGIAALTYADRADFEAHRYLGEGGRETIAADVGRFIGSAEVFLAEPRVLRPPPRPA